MKIYSQNSIIALSQFLLGDQEAADWLVKHDCKELVLLGQYIMNRSSVAYNTILDLQHYQLAAFIDALRRDSDAFKYLLNSDHKVWAATANASDGDDGAIAWLERTGNSHYARLASVIIQKWREYESNKYN